MKCKNKEIRIKGFEYNDKERKMRLVEFCCICTNDEMGKSLSIDNGTIQFTIGMEAIAEIFKDSYRK